MNTICAASESQIEITVNQLKVTLKFSDQPNTHIQDDILQILVSNYEHRIAAESDL